MKNLATMPSTFIFLLAFIIGVQPIATDMYLPTLPSLSQAFAEFSLLGLTIASTSTLTFFTLFYGLGQVVGGQWVDRYGRRSSLIASMAVYLLCGLGCVFAQSLPWLLVLRSIQGFATATVVVAARAALRDGYSVEEAPRIMARVYISMGIILVLCPLVGGWLATHGGWRLAFTFVTLYGAILLAWVVLRFPETQANLEATTNKVWDVIRTLYANHNFRIWTLLAAFAISGIFAYLTLTPHIFIVYFGWTPSQYSWVMTASACTFVFSNWVCVRLLKKYSTTVIAKLGSGLSFAGGSIQLAGSAFIDTDAAPFSLPIVLLIGHYLFQLGHGMLQTCAMVGAVTDFPHMAGRAAAWSGLTTMVFAFVISQTAASFLNAAHSNGVWPWSVTIALCSMGLMLVTSRLKVTITP